MVQVEYRLILGQNEFLIKAEVKDEKEFIEKMMFYSNLPKTAPGGGLDLVLAFRTTQKGHHYYSIICESEKKEYKFGQKLETNGGGLFSKGWTDLFGTTDEETNPEEAQQQTAAPRVGPPAVTAPKVAAPKAPPVPAAPKVTVTAPRPAAPAPVVVASSDVPQTATAVNPKVQQAATNVLARFGIQTPAKG